MRFLKFALLIGLLLPGAAGAKDKPAVAVFPFLLSSTENIDYIQQGVWGILISRLSADSKIEVVGNDLVLKHLKQSAKKDLTLTEVRSLGSKMKSDFVVWGKITKNGNNVSIEGKLVEVSTEHTSVDLSVQSQGLDEIIPSINDFAQRISKHVTGAASLAVSDGPVTVPALKNSVQDPAVRQAEREKQIIDGIKASKTGTLTSIPLSPDLLNKPQAATPQKP